MAKLPSLREVTRMLREIHQAWSHPDAGGEYVTLVLFDGLWTVDAIESFKASDVEACYGREYIPGDGLPFDAVGAARRLLAASHKGIDS